MELKKWTLCSPTAKNNCLETSLFKSIVDFKHFNDGLDNFIVEKNSKSLSEVYNAAIDAALEAGSDCLILVHDDVTLEHDPILKLKTLFENFDLVGLAGATQVAISAPALWHLMAGGFQGGNLRGCVAHSSPNGKHMTSFGQYPARVMMVDGVFMALSKKVLESGIRFDENNPSKFHGYDLNFSLDCHNAGLRVGVGDIYITHESPGLREFTPDFMAHQGYFLDKYGK